MASKKNYYWWAVVGQHAVRHWTGGFEYMRETFLISQVGSDQLNGGWHQAAADGFNRRAVACTRFYLLLYPIAR